MLIECKNFRFTFCTHGERLDNKLHSVIIFRNLCKRKQNTKTKLDHQINIVLIGWWNCNKNYLKMSIQSGWPNFGPVRSACCLHGSSITQAFGPYSSKIFFTAKSTSIDGGTDSPPDDEKSKDARRTRGWYVSVNDKI